VPFNLQKTQSLLPTLTMSPDSSQKINSTERPLAVHLLREWLTTGAVPSENRKWDRASPLCREIVLSSIRHRSAMEAWIGKLARNPPSEKLLPYLFTGLCQILLLDGVAEHAAVHTTIEIAKQNRIPKPLLGFMNALLRRAVREREQLKRWLEQQKPEYRYSHPGILIAKWEQQWGKEATQRILTWNQQRAPTWARLTVRGKHDQTHLQLPAGFSPCPGFSDFYKLPRGFAPTALPAFDQGAWYIQDPSTSLAPELLNVQPGESVLDACAAPGGKTIQLAESMGETTGLLTANEPNPNRFEVLRRNLARTGFSKVKKTCANLGDLVKAHSIKFDAILLDVPCSNSGVYQRRPEAKWRFTNKFLHQLVDLQYSILENALPLLAPGGRMVYSTCSIEEEETNSLVRRWLSNHPDFSLGGEIRLLPGERDTDGAYAVCLQRC